MPTMVRVYIRSVLIGVVLACCFVGALVALDVAHLRHLILTSDIGWLAVFLMVMFNTIIFGGVQFAIAIMSQAEKPSSSSGRKERTDHAVNSEAVPVAAKAGRRG